VFSGKSHGTSESERGNAVLARVVIRAILATLLAAPFAASQRPVDEYQLKAAFLYNFARFVEWPPEAFENPSQAFVFCVLGEDPFGHALDEVLDGRKIEGRVLTVRRISDARRARGCRLLFVSSSEPKSVLAVLAGIGDPGLLTVGESDSPAAEGMIIDFTLEDGKIRFVINAAGAERERLRVSSRLLSLATTVRK
jgi:hypothetical protein